MPDQKNIRSFLINEAGFSLIEVIVASMIMFAAIAISAGLFRTSALTLNKVNLMMDTSEVLPDIVEIVREGLMKGDKTGNGSLGDHYFYEYRSDVKEHAKNLISDSGFATGGFEYGNFDLALVHVMLDIKYAKLGAIKTMSFDYDEMIWSKNRG